MSHARELRTRLEQLPAEVQSAKSGTDSHSTAEVLKCAEQIRASRAELAELDRQLATQKDLAWSKLLTLRRGQAKEWELAGNNQSRRNTQADLMGYLYIGSAAFGGFLGGMTPLVASPLGFGLVSLFTVSMAAWWGHLKGSVERGITQAERVL